MSPGFDTLEVRRDDGVLLLRMARPETDNAIDETSIREMHRALDDCTETVVVVEGLPEVFSTGADIGQARQGSDARLPDPGPLYDLWARLAGSPFVSVAHVRGRAQAGGVGFVAAADVAICDEAARFALSELLFGLLPACVLPFLVRRVGFARANSMALTTRPISAREALAWGLVDEVAADSTAALDRLLRRLRALPADGVAAYKRYVGDLEPSLAAARETAIRASRRAFADPTNLARIDDFLTTGPGEVAGDGVDLEHRRIFELLVGHAREVVPELDGHRFSASDSLRELGINSIERAEILMMTLESLALHLPLVEMAEARDLGGLAEIIHARSA